MDRVEEKVKTPDGRRWLVSAARVGVPAPLGGFGAVLWAGGWLYHLLRHRGEWRVEVLEQQSIRESIKGSGFGPTWVLGILPETEAQALVDRTADELRKGTRTFPGPS